jgi:hypothetical protein
MRAVPILIGILALTLSAEGALACGCPKEAMLKANGTVSMLGGLKPPGPRRLPDLAIQAAANKAIPAVPLLMPVRSALVTRGSDRNTLEWLLLAP